MLEKFQGFLLHVLLKIVTIICECFNIYVAIFFLNMHLMKSLEK